MNQIHSAAAAGAATSQPGLAKALPVEALSTQPLSTGPVGTPMRALRARPPERP